MNKETNFLKLLVLSSIQILLGLTHCSPKLQNSTEIRCFERERQALLDMKDEIVDEYGRLSSWGVEDSRRDCCKWRGVHCHARTNHVTRLDLRGPLDDGLSTSTAPLRDLSRNHFQDSSALDVVVSMRGLRYLNLSGNTFHAPIPHLGNLSKLQHLDLNHALRHSKNLDWLSHLHSLETLDLSSVNLSTATNWLQAISKLTYLRELHLSGCELPYILPSALRPSINTTMQLAILDLSRNQLNPSYIRWWSNFSNDIIYIDLSESIVMGPIDDHPFRNMGSLRYLDLSYMKAKSENKLQYLDLSDNYLSGSLPDFSRFSSLTVLKVQVNKLNGTISEGFLKLPRLVWLNLGDNQITGSIPDVSFLTSLKKLYLYNNMFNGTLTQSVGHLSKLESLSLYSNNLEDMITEAHLFNLSRLKVLDLSYNKFLNLKLSPSWEPTFQLQYLALPQCKLGPRFPMWLRTQKKISFLDMSHSNKTDTVPSWFPEVARNLFYLNLSTNQIYGVFPNLSIHSLKIDVSFYLSPCMFSSSMITAIIDLSRNRISGSVTFLCTSTIWNTIDLSNNLLFDRLPNCFSNFKSLRYLNLASNNLSGKISGSFGSLQVLQWLHLRNNSFTGGFPASLRNHTMLEIIDLGENRLTGNIPDWIANSTHVKLVVLRLRKNFFNGSIPLNLCNLPQLQVLDLSSNQFSGAIPKCLQNLTTMTTPPASPPNASFFKTYFGVYIRHGFGVNVMIKKYVDGIHLMLKGNEVEYTSSKVFINYINLSNNSLSGEIPDEITNLTGLVILDLSRNNLSGSIPQNISRLKSLDFLDLSWNQLSGAIPNTISELSFLGVLNLSFNNLSGKIPTDSHFDYSAYIGNALLCERPILNTSCLGDDETHRDSNFNDDGNACTNADLEEDSFITQGFYISTVLGFVIGFWGTLGTIILNMSFRYAFFQMISEVGGYIYLTIVLNKLRLQRYFTRIM
ncbi:receptor-like protein EIX2 [Primulina huaijiensis]|uniref:receptor-like protein EIX2 n=1 Tax=Primulina huaijiensis TaxID=1492673 RepID=UPI003CC70F00